MYRRFGKRVLDLALGVPAAALLALPVAGIALAVWISSGRPVFFTQWRIGQHGQRFRLVKFRTMVPGASRGGSVTVAGDRRVTTIGRFLRRWKLDELPQLWNVLANDMTLVGPRPDVPGYADRLEGPARRVLDLKPGVTGPATLAYRREEELLAGSDDPDRLNDEIYADKVRLNLEYLQDMSLGTDLSILVRTIAGR